MSSIDYHAPLRPPRGTSSKDTAPLRPPRGAVSKDTSGRLMNIIGELSISKSDDRKKKMIQLKEDFKGSDARLIKLISANKEQLSVTMESFSKISAKNNTSQRGCHDVKEKMYACQKLLQCKREEIRRLWCESVEHNEVISMLKEINELKNIHHKVHDAIKQNDFTRSTELVVSSINLLEGKLSSVDALKELKLKVFGLRETLHSVLTKELHKCLYMSPEHIFVDKTSASCDGGEKTYEEIFSKTCRKEKGVCKLPVCDVGYAYDFQKDFNYEQISVILNCIFALNRLPETVEMLKEGLKTELNIIVKNSSKLMYDIVQNSTFPSCPNEAFSKRQPLAENSVEGEILLDLLEIIVDKFRYVAINQQSLLHNLEKIMMTNNMNNISPGYELADVLSEIQAGVEMFASDYLDLCNTSGSAERTTSGPFTKISTVSDISSFFLRKNIARHKMHALFKFDGSSHAINMKKYLQEEKGSLKGNKDAKSVDADQILVCEPTVKNIIVIFKPLKQLVSEIEHSLNLESGIHCPLHTFLMDCIKLFLDETSIEMNRLMEKVARSLEAWDTVMDVDELKKANIRTEILMSTFTLNATFKEMEDLIFALPYYSGHFVQLVYSMLLEYKDLCNSAFKGLFVYRDSSEEHQRVFSLSYARDEDISRLLRSLPNWIKLKVENHEEESHDFEESPEEVRFRNKEESELLIRNLSYCATKDSISLSEIVSDPVKLRNLALMHESLEWLSKNILIFVDHLPARDIRSSVPSALNEKFSEDNFEAAPCTYRNNKTCLKQIANDFEDLADSCLLILHLEVRAHSFFYLLPLSKQSSYMNRKDDQEAEPEVLRLNADLSRIEEALSPVLQPKKIKYIFEGLGELLATILINSVSNIKKINEIGVKKLGRNIFAIQQNLASITMTREVALDRARQYFDLLNHTFEDILDQIVEEGPQFQEHEYSAVIQLLHNSREGIYDQEPLDTYLDNLRQILDEVAVSV